MLIDLPENWLDFVHPVYREHMVEHDVHPDRLAPGVYEAQMWNFDYVIESFIANRYPFSDERQSYWREAFAQSDPCLQDDAERERVLALPHDYGVCDSYEQVLTKWPELVSDERSFFILITELEKKNESKGGWRWHKWGEYIGTQDPQCEYLVDEPVIEKIQLFHLYQFNSSPAPIAVDDMEVAS